MPPGVSVQCKKVGLLYCWECGAEHEAYLLVEKVVFLLHDGKVVLATTKNSFRYD